MLVEIQYNDSREARNDGANYTDAGTGFAALEYSCFLGYQCIKSGCRILLGNVTWLAKLRHVARREGDERHDNYATEPRELWWLTEARLRQRI